MKGIGAPSGYTVIRRDRFYPATLDPTAKHGYTLFYGMITKTLISFTYNGPAADFCGAVKRGIQRSVRNGGIITKEPPEDFPTL